MHRQPPRTALAPLLQAAGVGCRRSPSWRPPVLRCAPSTGETVTRIGELPQRMRRAKPLLLPLFVLLLQAQWTERIVPLWQGNENHNVTGPSGYHARGYALSQWDGYSTTYWNDNRDHARVCRTRPAGCRRGFDTGATISWSTEVRNVRPQTMHGPGRVRQRSDRRSAGRHVRRLERREESKMPQYTIMVRAAFGGNCADLDPKAAANELRQLGYTVTLMPRKYRPFLYLAKDDFLEAQITRDVPASELDREMCAALDEVDTVVGGYGGGGDECRPVGPDHVPFVEYFRGATKQDRRKIRREEKAFKEAWDALRP
jgi:hypothetical protein